MFHFYIINIVNILIDFIRIKIKHLLFLLITEHQINIFISHVKREF